MFSPPHMDLPPPENPPLLLKSTTDTLAQSALACSEILMDLKPCKSVISGGIVRWLIASLLTSSSHLNDPKAAQRREGQQFQGLEQ
ncbi:hypothetical protein Bca4012_058960 [Brassica carinata]